MKKKYFDILDVWGCKNQVFQNFENNRFDIKDFKNNGYCYKNSVIFIFNIWNVPSTIPAEGTVFTSHFLIKDLKKIIKNCNLQKRKTQFPTGFI